MATMDLMGVPTLTQKDMPYVMFESRTEEDAKESKAQGRMAWKDQHYARITPPGSRDVHYEQIPEWWGKMEQEVKAGRVMPEWVQRWKDNYAKWKEGQEIPEVGTPIRGWSMLSGAQQANVIAANILTVESLANANSEAMARLGMGALELKRRAEAWIIEKECVESGATKMKTLQRENDILKETIANLTEKVEALSKSVEARTGARK